MKDILICCWLLYNNEMGISKPSSVLCTVYIYNSILFTIYKILFLNKENKNLKLIENEEERRIMNKMKHKIIFKRSAEVFTCNYE